MSSLFLLSSLFSCPHTRVSTSLIQRWSIVIACTILIQRWSIVIACTILIQRWSIVIACSAGVYLHALDTCLTPTVHVKSTHWFNDKLPPRCVAQDQRQFTRHNYLTWRHTTVVSGHFNTHQEMGGVCGWTSFTSAHLAES